MIDQMLLLTESAKHAADKLGFTVKAADLEDGVLSSDWVDLDNCLTIGQVIHKYEGILAQLDNQVNSLHDSNEELLSKGRKLQSNYNALKDRLEQIQNENSNLKQSITQLQQAQVLTPDVNVTNLNDFEITEVFYKTILEIARRQNNGILADEVQRSTAQQKLVYGGIQTSSNKAVQVSFNRS